MSFFLWYNVMGSCRTDIAYAMYASRHVLQGLFSSPHFQRPNGTTFFLLYSKLQLMGQRLWSFQEAALEQSVFSNRTLSAVQSFNIHCITSSRRASNPSGSGACSFYKRAIKFLSAIVCQPPFYHLICWHYLIRTFSRILTSTRMPQNTTRNQVPLYHDRIILL